MGKKYGYGSKLQDKSKGDYNKYYFLCFLFIYLINKNILDPNLFS